MLDLSCFFEYCIFSINYRYRYKFLDLIYDENENEIVDVVYKWFDSSHGWSQVPTYDAVTNYLNSQKSKPSGPPKESPAASPLSFGLRGTGYGLRVTYPVSRPACRQAGIPYPKGLLK